MASEPIQFLCPRCGQPCRWYSGSLAGRGCNHCFTQTPELLKGSRERVRETLKQVQILARTP